MNLARRSELPLLVFGLVSASIAPLTACGDGTNSTSNAGAGGSTVSTGGATTQGGGGSGGSLFGGMGGGTTSSTSSSTSSSTTSNTGGPCQSGSPTTATTLFARKAGLDNVQSALGVATDAQSNIFLSGAFLGSIDFGLGALNSAGGNDAYVAKLNANGAAVWAKSFGDAAGNQYAQHVATDANGNVLVTGHFRQTINFGGGNLADVSNFFEDLFIAKLDGNGGHVWSKRYGDINNEESQSIATDPQGNVLFVGAFQKTIDFGGGPIIAEDGGFNAFVTKLSAAGAQQWAKSLGDMTNEQKALGVTSDKDSNVYVVGYFKGTIDLGGGALTADADKQSAFVVKYSPTGTFVWGKAFASTEASAVDVAVDATGNVFVLGEFKGAVNFGGADYDAGVANDVFLVKLDKDGDHVWSHAWGEKNKGEEATSLTLDADKPIVLGTFTGTIDFGGGALTSQGGFDAFMAKLDASGCQIHANAYGGAMLQRAESVALDTAGNIVFAGSFDGTVDFGTGALTANGTDAYVVKTKP